FSRFYTRKIGVLRKGLLGSPLSLTEGRVLYELAQRDPVTASDIAGELESGFLQRRVRCEPVSRENSGSYVEKPPFSRGCAGRGERRGRQRLAGRRNIGPTGGNISVGRYFSTAVPSMWFATVPALARQRGRVASGRRDIGELLVQRLRQSRA